MSVYGNNLEILTQCNVESMLMYNDMQLDFDTRYVSFIRPSFDMNEIIRIIKCSISECGDDNLVKDAMNGILCLVNSDVYSIQDKQQFLELYNQTLRKKESESERERESDGEHESECNGNSFFEFIIGKFNEAKYYIINLYYRFSF